MKALFALLALFLLPAAPRATQENAQRYRIASIEITTDDVYTDEEAAGFWIYRGINGAHFVTRPEVVRREMWFGEGDHITEAQAKELERKLRATGLFAEASVALRETDRPDGHPDGHSNERDLVVKTSDRFSLIVVAGGAVAGGADRVAGALGESNLFGTGNSFFVDYARNDRDEETFGGAYTNRHFLYNDLSLRVTAGETDLGDFGSLQLSSDFLHLGDPWAWSVFGGHFENTVDFFQLGDTVAEVPRERDALSASLRRGWGPHDLRETLGVSASYSDAAFGSAFGVNPGFVEVPGDTKNIRLAPFYSAAQIRERRKVDHLDTIDFQQDIELGWWPRVELAANARDEDGVGQQFEPEIGASLSTASEIAPEAYLTTTAGGSWRTHDGDSVGHDVFAALHAYHLGRSTTHTLAGSLAYFEAVEEEGLRRQVTLGEDNGLRGYPARHFSGERRALLNLEDRIDTGIEIYSMHLGLVVFADAGWVDGEATSPDDVLTSVGFGFRLGSSELFGAGILRIDVAFPLTDALGVEDDVSVSVAVDQVFSFFGGSNVL